MRFFKEFDGIIWEFNSVGEYINFVVNRAICYILVILLLFGLLVLIGRS